MTATRSLALALTVAAAALPFGCARDGDGWPDRPGPKVVASFPPVASIALAVAGGDAVVRPVMTTQSPHDADPKPADLRVVRRADLFLINGLGLDDRLTERVARAAGRDVKVVSLGAAVPPKELLEGVCEHDHDHDHAGHDHDTDPHVWLGVGHAKTFAAKVADELAALDPAHAAAYEQRAAAFAARMDQLKADGVATLKGKRDRKFLPFHGSMAYFAESFGLTMVDPIQAVPGQEPTPKKLDEIVKACVEGKVRVIAVEPQFSAQSSAKRILDELHRRGVPDAVVVELDPLETCPAADLTADWYEARMRANVAALAGALK